MQWRRRWNQAVYLQLACSSAQADHPKGRMRIDTLVRCWGKEAHPRHLPPWKPPQGNEGRVGMSVILTSSRFVLVVRASECDITMT
eukprot:2023491-Amphidinium_carterae.1